MASHRLGSNRAWTPSSLPGRKKQASQAPRWGARYSPAYKPRTFPGPPSKERVSLKVSWVVPIQPLSTSAQESPSSKPSWERYPSSNGSAHRDRLSKSSRNREHSNKASVNPSRCSKGNGSAPEIPSRNSTSLRSPGFRPAPSSTAAGITSGPAQSCPTAR